MAFHYSPKVVTDGLVLYYDMNNEKKSYLGKPTTNFITNGDFTGKANAGTGGTGGDNPLNEIVEASNPGDSPYCLRSTAVGGNIYTEYQMDLTTELVANTTYVMSCWYSFSPDWNGSTAVFHSRAYSASGANVATGADAGTAIETRVINGTTWTRAYQTITTPADYSNAFNWYLGYPSSNTAGYRYFTNIQMEQGTYPTPFTRTSRSSTTALRDLTNKNTITISSLTYANDRATSASFDGSTNYCQFPLTQTSPNNFTVEAWIYNTAHSSDTNIGRQIVLAYSGYNGWIFSLNGTGSFLQLRHHNFTNSSTAYNLSYGTGLSLNTWYHVAATDNGTTVTLYVNGVGVATTASATATTNGTITSTIGAWPGASTATYFTGKISSVRLYSRALSASEMQQNFNANRGRYGV